MAQMLVSNIRNNPFISNKELSHAIAQYTRVAPHPVQVTRVKQIASKIIFGDPELEVTKLKCMLNALEELGHRCKLCTKSPSDMYNTIKAAAKTARSYEVKEKKQMNYFDRLMSRKDLISEEKAASSSSCTKKVLKMS
jgi:hypothetical protein